MSDSNPGHVPMDDPDKLIDAYLDESLTPEQGAALNAWVKQGPANARRFAKATWLHRQVYDRLHVHDLQQLQDDVSEADDLVDPNSSGVVLAQLLELERGSGDSGIVDLTEELKRRDHARKRAAAARSAMARRAGAGDPSDVARVLVIPKVMAYGAVAAVLLGLLSVVYVSGWGRTPATNNATAGNPSAVEPPALPPVVAELVRGEGLVWGGEQVSLPTRPGTELRRGRLELEAGIAELRFQSGAVATFRGPAVVELRGDNRMALVQGAMVARVPEQAYGFSVDTLTMRVVDLGTEFAVTAEPSGDSAVQVFLGEVTAAAFDIAGRPGAAAPLVADRGVAVDFDTRASRPIEVDGRAFADLAPHVALLYRNLVVNGDFEQGEPANVRGQEFRDVDNRAVPGWEDTGPGTLLPYDEAARHDYPDPATDLMPDDRGRAYYAGMGAGAIRQAIDVTALAKLVDADAVRFDLSAWLGGYAGQDDHLLLTVRFLDGRGRAIGDTLTLDPVRAVDRGGVSGFVERSAFGRIPIGARSVVIELDSIGGNDPPYVRDGYADNVELVLSAD